MTKSPSKISWSLRMRVVETIRGQYIFGALYIVTVIGQITFRHGNCRMEMMIKILHAAAVLSLVFAFPDLVLCLQYNITGFRAFRSHSIWVNVMQTCFLVMLSALDWAPTVDMILIHASNNWNLATLDDWPVVRHVWTQWKTQLMKSWLCRSNPDELNSDRKWAFHKMYRMQLSSSWNGLERCRLPPVLHHPNQWSNSHSWNLWGHSLLFTVIAAAVASFATIALGANSMIDNTKV